MSVRMWTHLTTVDFQKLEKDKTLVLMPFGSIEQHGSKLPVGTDSLLVEEVLKRVRPRVGDLNILILPTLWCTKSNEHKAFEGTLYLKPETLMSIVMEIAANVKRYGFQKLVLINWHGGNRDLLNMMALDIRQQCDLLVFVVNLVNIFFSQFNLEHEDRLSFHAGLYETCLMLAAFPDLVREGPYEGLGSDRERGRLAKSFEGYDALNPVDGFVTTAWQTEDLTEDGVIGNPSGANAEEGEKRLESAAEQIGAILRKIETFEYKN